MKRFWQVQRTHQSHAAHERRWERVYQLLLDWSAETDAVPTPNHEETHANCDLRPRLDTTPSTDADH